MYTEAEPENASTESSKKKNRDRFVYPFWHNTGSDRETRGYTGRRTD